MPQRNTKKSKEEAQTEIWERFPHIDIISDYTGANNKVLLRCNNCGYEWSTTARAVASSKRGCPKCGVKEAADTRAKEHFLSKFDNTDFDLLEFKDYMHVKVKCKTCGTIRYTNANNIYRFGCKHCAMTEHGDKTRSNIQDFISKAKIVHGDIYDYSQVVYYNCKTPIKIICPKHGEFWQGVNHHLQGEGCPECGKERIANSLKLTLDEFIDKSQKVHREYYDYSKVKYVNNTTKVTIVCPVHGDFEQLPCDHLRGAGCPKCNFSHGEREIEFLLNDWEIPHKTQYKQQTATRNFRFDFYIETPTQNFIIEYNGRQHYEPVSIFGGMPKFLEQCERDECLRKYCKDNNIRLFEIKYDANIKQEMQVILNELLPHLQEIVDDVTDKNEEPCDGNIVLTEFIAKGNSEV